MVANGAKLRIEQGAGRGDWGPFHRLSNHKPISSNPFYSQGRLSPVGAKIKKKKQKMEMGERRRKEEKMKRGEIAKGNEKNFIAQFLLLPDPIIRFCI